MTRYDVDGVQFGDPGVSISYTQIPEDVRLDGNAFQQHTLHISWSAIGLADDLRDLQERTAELLVDALEDFRESPPWTPDLDDDDDAAMGV